MSETIIKALAQLDVGNDAHWTGDGAPRIDVVKFFAANDKLTRQDIFAVAPTFSRLHPVLGTVATAAPEVVSVLVAEAKVPTAVQEVAASFDNHEDVLQANIAKLSAEREAIVSTIETAKRSLTELDGQLDTLVHLDTASAGNPEVARINAYKEYLASQTMQRAQRMEKARELQKAGIPEMLRNLTSPLDAAFRSRKR